MSRRELEAILATWSARARPWQVWPGLLTHHRPWERAPVWLLMGGRGCGKTRTGAEWVRGLATGEADIAPQPLGRIAIVGETLQAVRDVMIEGPAGVLAVHPRRRDRPVWSPSLRKLEWRNGAVAHAFSAEDPDSLRGPQFEAAWSDELAKWRHAEEAWTMLQFGLRLGTDPRQLITTTPRPIPILKRLMADPRVARSHARTIDNAENLAPGFIAAVSARYGGTRIGRQELDGEWVEDRPDGLWTRALIEETRAVTAPPLARLVVAVDPPASSSRRADACGIVAAGRDREGRAFVLADETASGLKPPDWAAKAIALYHRLEADALLVETNQGGEMATSVLRQVDPSVPVTSVRATRGKYLRAEPVAMLYAKRRVAHVGAFPELEDELCDFGPDGLSTGRSPDRLDALVWALTALLLEPSAPPRIRVV